MLNDVCLSFNWTVELSGKVNATEDDAGVHRSYEREGHQRRLYRVEWKSVSLADIQTLRAAFLEAGMSGPVLWTAPDESEAKAYRFNKFVEIPNSLNSFACEAELVLLPGVKAPY